jgi:hypothetical protein
VSTLLVNAHVVTMDDEGTEHPGGWILLDEGFVQLLGTGNEPTPTRCRISAAPS